MATHTAKFVLNDASITVVVKDGYFSSAKYTNPYPFPLNFQVVDTAPRKGGVFYYTIPMLPFKTDYPLPVVPGVNVEGLYAKIALGRS